MLSLFEYSRMRQWHFLCGRDVLWSLKTVPYWPTGLSEREDRRRGSVPVVRTEQLLVCLQSSTDVTPLSWERRPASQSNLKCLKVWNEVQKHTSPDCNELLTLPLIQCSDFQSPAFVFSLNNTSDCRSGSVWFFTRRNAQRVWSPIYDTTNTTVQFQKWHQTKISFSFLLKHRKNVKSWISASGQHGLFVVLLLAYGNQ